MILGAMPILVGGAYLVLQETNGTEANADRAGVTMLIALGFAMAFGFLVLLRGAKDL
jgi:Flp pilus assembly protein TadB